ncbi:hypothetical protein KA183_15005 [bacterium]|nr:hypothetical protein [bacterium]
MSATNQSDSAPENNGDQIPQTFHSNWNVNLADASNSLGKGKYESPKDFPDAGYLLAGFDTKSQVSNRDVTATNTELLPVLSSNDPVAPDKLATNIYQYLSITAFQRSGDKYSLKQAPAERERLIARDIRNLLYYSQAEQIEAVDRIFAQKYGKELMGDSNKGLFDAMKVLTPNFAARIEMVKDLRDPKNSQIPLEFKVDASTLLSADSGIKPNTFTTIQDKDGKPLYSVFVPDKIDSRGLTIMALDGARKGDNQLQTFDFQTGLTAYAQQQGAVVIIPHAKYRNLEYRPTLASSLDSAASTFASMFLPADIYNDKSSGDGKVLNMDKQSQVDMIKNGTLAWNLPGSQNIFPENNSYNDLERVQNAWQDLRRRVSVPDRFGIMSFSNGGLVAQDLLEKMPDQARGAVLAMSTRMADAKAPTHGANIKFWFAMGDTTLPVEQGGLGWRSQRVENVTPTNLHQSKPINLLSVYAQANQVYDPVSVNEKVPASYVRTTFSSRNGYLLEMSTIADKTYGHALPDVFNMDSDYRAKPAPLNFTQDSVNFLKRAMLK